MSDLESLRRKAAADPADAESWRALLRARFRVEGPAAARELLRDLPTWEAAGEELQDLAVGEVGRLLGAGYEALGARWFESEHPQGEWKQNEAGRRYFKRRVGVVRRGALELHLIPGAPGLAPFLLGSRPLNAPGLVARARAEGLAAALGAPELRLPTMAEWLRACAGGAAPALYSWDDPPEDSFFRHWDGGEVDRPHRAEVANPFGLIDMIGGDWEQVVNAEGGPSFCGGSPRALGRIRIRPRRWTLDGYLPDGLGRCYRPARSIPGAE